MSIWAPCIWCHPFILHNWFSIVRLSVGARGSSRSVASWPQSKVLIPAGVIMYKYF